MSQRGARLPVIAAEAEAPRANARVVLVGYEDSDNLGVRYLASRLRERGHAPVLLNIRDAHELTRVIVATRPHVVGFSLIFQYLVREFRALVQAVRATDVETHVTFGGHYASFEPEALFEQIPEIDSIVRFEGEDTLVDLSEALAEGRDWRAVPGLAHVSGDEVVCTPPRPGRTDLDTLPWPVRDDIDYRAMALPTASVLGSRGCPWRCSFCSIITFYAGNGTKGRRRRDPVAIVDELEHLQRDRGVEVILWQDDDFLAGGRRAIEWAHALADECVRRGLDQHLRWKISCRSDELKPGRIEPLVRAGLTHVYMGVEAGDPQSLEHMNKLLTPDVHMRAREVLVANGLSFDFGFMLFEPWSTLDIIRRNLAFLREFSAGGVTPVGFGRLLPYAGTAVARRLGEEGRLIRRDDGEVDYEFLDPAIERLYAWVLGVLSERNYTANGTANLLRRVLFEANLDLPRRPRRPATLAAVRAIASVSNTILIDTVSAALERVAEHDGSVEDDLVLRELAAHHRRQDQLLRADLERLMGRSLRWTSADAGAECPI